MYPKKYLRLCVCLIVTSVWIGSASAEWKPHTVRQLNGYVNSPEGHPQYGIEAIVSKDNGQSWDLDHRYILHAWQGDKKEKYLWRRGCQATSSILLPDGSILTTFGTGYRSRLTPDGLSAPRDVGMVKWRLGDKPLNDDRTLRDTRPESDIRNVLDPSNEKIEITTR